MQKYKWSKSTGFLKGFTGWLVVRSFRHLSSFRSKKVPGFDVLAAWVLLPSSLKRSAQDTSSCTRL